MKVGDLNTKCVHSKANGRKKTNVNWDMEDEDGRWCDKVEDITELIENYFSAIFTLTSSSREAIDKVL